MDFQLTDRALSVQEGLKAIAAKYDIEYWSKCERDVRFPEEVWSDLAGGGWLGLCIPEEFGGGGAGLLEMAVVTEELSYGGGGQAASFIYVLTPGFGALTLARHGTPEQKREILPGIARGEVEFCFALTEPDAGSDTLSITTSARRDGSDFLINGQKIWISGVQRAKWMIVVTRSSAPGDGRRTDGFTLLLVDVPEAIANGSLEARPIEKFGSNLVHSNQVFFDDVRVPSDRVLGEADQGFKILWDILNPERILAAAGGVGHAELALRLAPRVRLCAHKDRFWSTDRRQPRGCFSACPGQGADGVGPAHDVQGGLALRPRRVVRTRGQRRQAHGCTGSLGSDGPRVPDLRRNGVLKRVPH